MRNRECKTRPIGLASARAFLSPIKEDELAQYRLIPQRHRIIRRRIDLERGGGDAGHGKRADRGDHRHQALEPHCLLGGGVALLAQALVGEDLARHSEARALARVGQARRLARVDRVDDRLLDADGKRVAHLRVPGITRVPVAGDGEVDELVLAARQRPRGHRGAQGLARLEHLRQADIGVVRPADDAARLLGRVVDACLLGVHIGTVDDGDARHAMPRFDVSLRAQG
jgi:hypothetical protein